MAKKLTLSDKNEAQLKEHLMKQREELRTLRFVAAGGRPKDASGPKKTRKEIARTLTEMTTRKNATA